MGGKVLSCGLQIYQILRLCPLIVRVGVSNFAVLPIQGQGGFRRLKCFTSSPMPVGAKMVVVFNACIEHRVLRALGPFPIHRLNSLDNASK